MSVAGRRPRYIDLAFPSRAPEAALPEDIGDAEWSSVGRPQTARGHLAGWFFALVLGAILSWYLVILPAVWLYGRLS